MKKTYINISMLFALALLGVLSSCNKIRCKQGSGKMITETRKMSDFDELDISGGYKVKLVQDSSFNVQIRADDNLMKYIKADVNGGELRIHNSRGICSSGEIEVIIGVRNLKEVHASGAIELTGNGRINTGDINFEMSGSTNVDLELFAATVNTNGSGATEIKLKGQAGTHNVDMSGSSDIDALDFVVGKYNIETSGASHCKINVLNNLSVHTSGSSEIEYRGNPSNISKDKSGASSITRID